MNPAPASRIRPMNEAPVREGAGYVLYWMTAARRRRYNFALQHSVAIARDLGRPLVILEALRADYPWACARFHQFVLEGMAANAVSLDVPGVLYYPYAEPAPGAGKGLLTAMAANASIVIGDDYPCFFLPRMSEASAPKLDVRFELIDGNGLLPMTVVAKPYPSASSYRRIVQKYVPGALKVIPEADPLAAIKLPPASALPREVARRWPRLTRKQLADVAQLVRAIDVPQEPAAVVGARGGESAARKRLKYFVKHALPGYARGTWERGEDGTSGLSPWLHFGHIGVHEIFAAVAAHERWTARKLPLKPTGKREGWWGMSASSEAFLDQLVTWRELGFNACRWLARHDAYESLPRWALATLEHHAGDRRSYAYSLEQFRAARTHDALWNAAQRQLLREGVIHNGLRMLWGKKILEWSASPRDAMATMIELNNAYALDGRDPNSYCGIFWVLGRYDKPWPERAVYGKVRSMSSERTLDKFDARAYMAKYGV